MWKGFIKLNCRIKVNTKQALVCVPFEWNDFQLFSFVTNLYLSYSIVLGWLPSPTLETQHSFSLCHHSARQTLIAWFLIKNIAIGTPDVQRFPSHPNTWWPFGDRLVTAWWPLGDHLVTTRPQRSQEFLSGTRWDGPNIFIPGFVGNYLGFFRISLFGAFSDQLKDFSPLLRHL